MTTKALYKLFGSMLFGSILLISAAFGQQNSVDGQSLLIELSNDVQSVRQQQVQLQRQFDSERQDRRQLQGGLEELEFQFRKLEKRIDQLVSSLDARLAEIEEQLASPNAGLASESEGLTLTEGFNAQKLSQENEDKDTPTGVLGQLRTDEAGNILEPELSELNNQPATILERYNAAVDLIGQNQYIKARQQLDTLLQDSSDDPLSSNIMYWIGETYYVERDYDRAITWFARGALKYPEGSKSLDSLLKLGLSLGNLNRNEDACKTFAQMDNHSQKIESQMALLRDNAKQRYGC